MATSGTATFNLEFDDLIEESYERCGLESRTPQRPMPPPAMKKGGMAKGKGSGGKTGAEMLKYGRNMAKVASQRPK